MDELTIREIWLRKGSPERMVIHVKATKDHILLVDGKRASPVTLTQKNNPLSKPSCDDEKRGSILPYPVTLIRTCKGCMREFHAKRITAEFCSDRCKIDWHRRMKLQKAQREALEQLKILDANPIDLL
jgi:hypothetical protein